jgi:hypothetical protein
MEFGWRPGPGREDHEAPLDMVEEENSDTISNREKRFGVWQCLRELPLVLFI